MSFKRTGGSWAHEYACLSSDTKPTGTEAEELKIPNGSSCIEMDTARVFMYDRDNSRWIEL